MDIYQVAMLADGCNTKILKAVNTGEELRPPLKNEPYVAAGVRTSPVQDAATCGSGYIIQTQNSLYVFLNVPKDALQEICPEMWEDEEEAIEEPYLQPDEYEQEQA